MRPLTDTLPKPLLTVGGKALIEYHLGAIAAAGIRRVVINLAWQGEKLRAALGDGSRYGVEITYSEESPRALETGGGIFKALPLLGEGPFLVVNGDVWTDWSLPPALELKATDFAHFVLVPNPPQHTQGDFALMGERVVAAGPRHTYSGIGLYRAAFFDGCEPSAFPLLPLMQRAIQAGRVSGELYGGRWHDIGTPERLAALDRELSSGQ